MQHHKERVALSSIAASGALTLAKLAVGFASGSLAILSEAAHSALDFLATLITYFAVRISGKPADEDHQYGHGKFESIAALAETGLLFLLAAVIIWEALQRLLGDHGHTVEASVWTFAVIGGSIVVDFFRARALNKVAKQTSSHALEADALHFSSDMWSSLAVLVGLGAIALGYPMADSIAAIVVAILVCWAGWRLVQRNVGTLTDVAPQGVAEEMTKIVQAIDGIVSVERVRVRQVGPTLFADISAAVSRTLPLDRVASIKSEIDLTIRKKFSESEINVTIDPRALDDESVLERVMVIARNRGLAVHHVTVHHLKDRLAVSLDLEVDGSSTLGEAHEIATELESAIKADFGSNIEVETHIEPMQTTGIAGRDAPIELQNTIAAALRALASGEGQIRDVHSVRVRETSHGLVVNFHCYTDPSLSIEKVHAAVDDIERRLRAGRTDIHRVIGHAEPPSSRPH